MENKLEEKANLSKAVNIILEILPGSNLFIICPVIPPETTNSLDSTSKKNRKLVQSVWATQAKSCCDLGDAGENKKPGFCFGVCVFV